MTKGFISLSTVLILTLLLSAGALGAVRGAYLSREHSWYVLEHTRIRMRANECTALVIYRCSKGYSYELHTPTQIYIPTSDEVCSISIDSPPPSLSITTSASSSISSIVLHTNASFSTTTREFLQILRSYEAS